MDFIENFKNMRMDFSHFETWQMWGIGGIGLLLLFLGYKIKKIAFFVVWFLLGYMVATYLAPVIANAWPEAATDFWQGLIPILGGLLLGLMGFMIEKVCLGGACFGLTILITAQYFGADMQTMAIGGAIGVLAGGVAVMMMKPATIVATSIAGGYALAIATLALFPDLDEETLFWPIILGSAVIGAGVQFVTTRHD